MGVLDGVKVVEVAGIGPGPFAGMVLADMGADVLRVDRTAAEPAARATRPRTSSPAAAARSALDLKSAEGAEVLLDLVAEADVLLEGFRPGVAERLGFGPEVCHERNPRLVFGRMTGWGQDGPQAQRAGHDLTYLATAGVVGHVEGPDGSPGSPDEPRRGLRRRRHAARRRRPRRAGRRATSGRGQTVDAAIVDGGALQMAMIWGMRAQGRGRTGAGANLLDGGAPFYETYRCADGKYVAVGSIEPQFYAALMSRARPRGRGHRLEPVGPGALAGVHRAARGGLRDPHPRRVGRRPRADRGLRRRRPRDGGGRRAPARHRARDDHGGLRRTPARAGPPLRPHAERRPDAARRPRSALGRGPDRLGPGRRPRREAGRRGGRPSGVIAGGTARGPSGWHHHARPARPTPVEGGSRVITPGTLARALTNVRDRVLEGPIADLRRMPRVAIDTGPGDPGRVGGRAGARPGPLRAGEHLPVRGAPLGPAARGPRPAGLAARGLRGGLRPAARVQPGRAPGRRGPARAPGRRRGRRRARRPDARVPGRPRALGGRHPPARRAARVRPPRRRPGARRGVVARRARGLLAAADDPSLPIASLTALAHAVLPRAGARTRAVAAARDRGGRDRCSPPCRRCSA